METEFLLQILGICALVLFIILSTIFLFSINSVFKSIKETSRSITRLSEDLSNSMKQLNLDISELKEKMLESLQSIESTSNQIKATTEKLEAEVLAVTRSIKPYENLLDDVYNKIAPPILTASKYISALSKGVSVFTAVLGKKKQ